jgi:hypothetical protein
MNRAGRTVLKWSAGILGTAVVLALLYAGILFYPTPLFAHSKRFGSYLVCSDRPISEGMPEVIDELERRLSAMEHASSGRGHRIFLCNSPRRYAFFARLARKSSESLAIGLSLPNETFVSISRVRRFAETNGGVLRHTRFEGNLAEVVAHEIAHFHSLRALGWRRHLALPMWKSEGWAEYQANLAAIRDDPAYSLPSRIDRLLDDDFWAEKPRLARRLWEAQILVEFLGEEEGYRLSDLAREEVTESFARGAMLRWRRDPGTS